MSFVEAFFSLACTDTNPVIHHAQKHRSKGAKLEINVRNGETVLGIKSIKLTVISNLGVSYQSLKKVNWFEQV